MSEGHSEIYALLTCVVMNTMMGGMQLTLKCIFGCHTEKSATCGQGEQNKKDLRTLVYKNQSFGISHKLSQIFIDVDFFKVSSCIHRLRCYQRDGNVLSIWYQYCSALLRNHPRGSMIKSKCHMTLIKWLINSYRNLSGSMHCKRFETSPCMRDEYMPLC